MVGADLQVCVFFFWLHFCGLQSYPRFAYFVWFWNLQFALPHVMGWDRYMNQHPKSLEKNSSRAVPQLMSTEWDRWWSRFISVNLIKGRLVACGAFYNFLLNLSPKMQELADTSATLCLIFFGIGALLFLLSKGGLNEYILYI